MFRGKSYYRKLDEILESIEDFEKPRDLLAWMVDRIIDVFAEDIGITSGRLYVLDDGEDYLLVHCAGITDSSLKGLRLPLDYPPVEAALSSRLVVMNDNFPGLDPEIEGRLQVDTFATFALENGRYIVAFGLNSELEQDHQLFALSTIRHTLSLRLRQLSSEEEIDRAEAIQLSLLPQRPPDFEGFDIAARAEAAEAADVGGDIHDFIDVGGESLGLAVGDASGHGLPAALQARDVVTGLRMGVEREFKITSVIQRLNRVIHSSNLSTRFVSLFYGELERNGNLIYVNAGHCEPILLGADGRVERLDSGGMILGPMPNAVYMRGYIYMEPGDRLLIFSDGLSERARKGEEFSEERLVALFGECGNLTAAETVDRIFQEVRAFDGDSLWEDDVTAMVVKREAGS